MTISTRRTTKKKEEHVLELKMLPASRILVIEAFEEANTVQHGSTIRIEM